MLEPDPVENTHAVMDDMVARIEQLETALRKILAVRGDNVPNPGQPWAQIIRIAARALNGESDAS